MAKKTTKKKQPANKKPAPIRKSRASLLLDRIVLEFDDALQVAEGTKHLLYRQRISIALFPDIFTYGTLFDKARSTQKLSKRVAGVFELLETTDFEQVMEALQNASALMSVYAKDDPKLAKKLQADA